MEASPCRLGIVDRVATITLDRPTAGNALSHKMVAGIAAALADAIAGDAACIVLRGEGRHLCTGGDVKFFAALANQSSQQRVAAMEAVLRAAEPMLRTLIELPVPLVVACRGVSAGGGLAFSLAADLVLADESASFRFSHLDIGVPPDAGISWLLPRAVGRSRAFALIAERTTVGASEACELGIVTRLSAADALWQGAGAVAQHLAEVPTSVMRAAKRLLARDGDAFAAQLVAERAAVLAAIASDDFASALQHFLGSAASAPC